MYFQEGVAQREAAKLEVDASVDAVASTPATFFFLPMNRSRIVDPIYLEIYTTQLSRGIKTCREGQFD